MSQTILTVKHNNPAIISQVWNQYRDVKVVPALGDIVTVKNGGNIPTYTGKVASIIFDYRNEEERVLYFFKRTVSVTHIIVQLEDVNA